MSEPATGVQWLTTIWLSRWLAVAASLAVGVGVAACASSGGPTGPVEAPRPRVGAVNVDPPSGPIGTLFTLTATGLRKGETVAFEITFPDVGKAFPGAALAVPADGVASTTYRATAANQPGGYVVRLTGPPGGLAEGRFTVTGGTVTLPPTTGRTATTLRTGRTTTTARVRPTTSTSASARSSTTPATRPATTTTSTPAAARPAPTAP